ncbi:MAG TPA: YfcE family phosphodiesterase [Thermoanaerobaculia bacterium]|nr:YfcE family phosphodiesterase [Thermoanaerobaculia bacterium]
MRILVVSDIHANWAALREMPENVDRVLFLGDLVDYGPDPRPCIDWVRDHKAVGVRGNHDNAVAFRVGCGCAPAMRDAAEETRGLMWDLLDPADVAALGALPLAADVTLGGVRFHLVHATPSDPLYTYLRPDQGRRWADEIELVDADVILVGHTHLPMVMRVGKKVVVNPGSVGQPRDGDPRAAFAIVEDGEPRLERVTYDVEETVEALASRALTSRTVGSLSRVLRSGGRVGPDEERKRVREG